MAPFKIQPHNRLQEWVAEEKGYFAAEGLEYVFHFSGTPDGVGVGRSYHLNGSVQSTEEVKSGAFETMETGRTCDISAASHWGVTRAAPARPGRIRAHR